MTSINLPEALWLRANGYEHLCFISWARKSGSTIREAALACKTTIERPFEMAELPLTVFFDEAGLFVGDLWSTKIPRALCRSLCMVSFCCPAYYNSEYCGREWATMDHWGKDRLGVEHGLILPVVVWGDRHPDDVSSLQYTDISDRLLCPRPNLQDEDWFRTLADTLIRRIAQAGSSLYHQKRAANCDPPVLAHDTFVRYRQEAQPKPLLFT